MEKEPEPTTLKELFENFDVDAYLAAQGDGNHELDWGPAVGKEVW